MSRVILDILGFFDVECYINVDCNPCIATRPANVVDVQTALLRITPVNY